MNGQISAISALGDDPDVAAKVPFLPAAAATLANAKTQPTSTSASGIFDPLAATLSQVATTDITPEDALNALQSQLQGITK